MRHKNVTHMVLHISHNAYTIGGPDSMHYEHVYCTTICV